MIIDTQFIPLADILALCWLIIVWFSYTQYTLHRNQNRKNGLVTAMDQVREEWVASLLKREVRIMDSQMLSGLVRKETFFASTTLLILASTAALLGVGDKANELFSEIPFIPQNSPMLWQMKVTTLALIFVFAFFKFTWSIRQHSYCAILLGALPEANTQPEPAELARADQLASLSNLAARHFNDGMRAYYFALAELSWFFHPFAFIAATAWVVMVLYRREFHSKALGILSMNQERHG